MRSICAYKGRASYFSLDDEPEIAWTYPEPLREAAGIADRVAFFNELADIAVDGTPPGRPVTPSSRR